MAPLIHDIYLKKKQTTDGPGSYYSDPHSRIGPATPLYDKVNMDSTSIDTPLANVHSIYIPEIVVNTVPHIKFSQFQNKLLIYIVWMEILPSYNSLIY